MLIKFYNIPILYLHAQQNFTKSEYNKNLWDALGSELKTSSKLQDLAKYKILLNFIMDKASSNEKVQDIISGMLAKEIPKENFSNPLFYLKILFS